MRHRSSSIFIIWLGFCIQVGPPAAAEDPGFYSSSVEVRYDVKSSRSLNQRFTPPPGLRTMAVRMPPCRIPIL